MLKFLKYLRTTEWLLLALCAGLIVLQVWLDLKLPDYMQTITVLVQTPTSEMKEIWQNGGYMLLCALGSLAAAILVCFVASRVSATLSKRIRENVYKKVSTFSSKEMKHFSTASLITRTTNDITQLQLVYALSIQLLLKAPVMAIWAICKIAGKGWEWSVATATAVGLLLCLLAIVICFALPRFKKVQKLTDALNGVTRESLNGVRVVRAYNAENEQEAKFEVANKNVTTNQLAITRIMALLLPVITLVLNGLTLSIYWIGAVLINNQPNPMLALDTFSNMVVYTQYAMQVVMAFMLLVMIFMILPRAIVSAKRIHEVLDTTPNIQSGTTTDTKDHSGTVEFKNVSFKYPDAEKYVIKNISFTANSGETVALIGSTGSGKSTLINLLPRLYDATEGEILVDGVNVKDLTLQSLHQKIGYVSQKAILFEGTIKDNIVFGKDTSSDEKNIQNALEVAQALEFTSNLEQKELSHVAQMGTNFSGGQKQRLSIARAVAKNPEIMIFDDSFSALDYKTDKTLRKALKTMPHKPTTLIVAQRIGTILDADKILVLDEGEIVGMGTHQELLSSCKVYQEIALSQLSKEELENA